MPGTVFDQSRPDCKKGGLVTKRHNELRDGVADLAGKAFTPSHVRDDPLIYSGRAVKRKKATSAGSNGNSEPPAAPEVTEQKGDLLIRDLWQQGKRNKRATFLSGTSGNRGPTVFTTCVS